MNFTQTHIVKVIKYCIMRRSGRAAYIGKHAHTRARAHTHTHTYIYIYIYTHTHTHTYTYITVWFEYSGARIMSKGMI